MGILTTKMRDNLPQSDFGLPGQGKYPMPDASHAANAKARATQQVNTGNLSSSQKAEIDAKANAVLRHNPSKNLGKYHHPRKVT